MAICMSMLQRADGIYLLDGWEDSAGASAEYHLAYKLQLKIMAQQCISIHAKEVIKNMSSSNGTVVGAMSPAAQSNIDGKLSISWDAIHSLDSRINTLADRLLPVSNPTESGSATGDKVKLSEPNASPIALAIMSQAQQLGTLVNKLDEITARLDC